MRLFFVAALVVVALSANTFGIVTIDPDNPYIQYTGRINYADPKAPIMWWPGCDVIANFEGTSINVKLNDYGDNYFYVIIDDGEPDLIDLTPGAATYTAAVGLTDSVHKIRLFKRTETPDGEVGFEGFELEDGKNLVAGPTRPQRRIEFYGDSITAGYSVALPIGTGDSTDAFGKDNYYTYASVTARNLGAEYHCNAVSGITLYIDKWGTGVNMQTSYYNKRSRFTAWDFSEWTPQIVVINLGQNDYYGPYTQEDVESNYINFAQTLRGHYPDAYIIIALGDMDSASLSSPFSGYIQNAVAELNTTYNDPKVYSLIFPYGRTGHPRVARNAVMADQLTEFIGNNIPGFGNGPDINSDSYVNNFDFTVMGSQWQQTGCGLCDGADVTGDGNVNFEDILVFAGEWLADYTVPTVLEVVNGSFETPMLDDAIANGSPGVLGSWASIVNFDGWVETGSAGANVIMVADGNQNMYWNDAQGRSIEQTLSEPVASAVGAVYTVTYTRRVVAQPAIKTMQYRAELLIGGEVVDSEEYSNQSVSQGQHQLTFTADGSQAGEDITICFSVDANLGWTAPGETQTVLIDAVSIEKTGL